MKKYIFTFTFLILLGSFVQILSQTGTFYSTDKELSNSLINSIYQDKRNYIWIATEDGLNKFDGFKFTIYKNKSGDTKTIKNNYVRSLFEDSHGHFWVGCINGLLLYKRAEDSFSEVDLYNEKTKIHPHITSIIESKEGEIWITTSGEGLIRIKKDSKVYEVESKLSRKLCSNFLTTIFQDSKQNIWIGSENQGLNMYSVKTGKLKVFSAPQSIGSNQISSICEDNKGNIFVGTLTGGLFKLNTLSWKFEQILSINSNQFLSVKSLLFDKQNRLLVGTDGNGIKIYNAKTNRLEDFQMPMAPFDISKTKVHALLYDKSGNLWVGLFQKGVFLSPNNPNKFNYFGYKSYNRNVIGSSCVMSVLKDKNKTLWVGTDNDGLYRMDMNGKRTHYVHTNAANSVSSTVMSIIEGNNGNIWLGSYIDGLASFDKNSGKCTYYNAKTSNTENNPSANKIICLGKDNNNILWVGTNGAGAFVFDISKKIYTEHYSQVGKGKYQLLNDWINCILYDREGIVWLGSYNGICSINTRTGKTISYTSENGILPGNIIFAINEDHKGNLWIGTTEGLVCFDKKTKKSKIYTMADGLPSNVICGIQEDENGNIWLSTHMGISKLIISENRFVNYYAFDGLQGNEFSKGAAFKSTDGEMIFGGINGVSTFYPSKIYDQRRPFKVYLTGLNIMDKPVIKGQKSSGNEIIDGFISDINTIHLSYKDNMFSLEFSTFDFGSPERVYYRYKLEGLNSQWMNTELGVNRISFTNLNYGNYKLKVAACVQDNISQEREIYIVISPPWYLSWWAKIIYFILLVLSVWGAVKYTSLQIKRKQDLMRREHAEQINEAKLQFFINISHEIRTPLTLIISPIQKLISENIDAENQKVYQMMYRNANRILRLINQLMDIRKIDKGLMIVKFSKTDIIGFIEDLIQTFEYQAKKRNIRFSFISPPSPLNVWIDMNNFDKVLLNILSNAFKFTPENGEIKITLVVGEDENEKGALQHYFEINVSDTGIGIEKEKIEKIFERFYQIDNDQTKSNFGTGIGLHLARSLVELQHGILFARNKIDGHGSEFIIRLPLGNKHLSDLELEKTILQLNTISELNNIEVELYDETVIKQVNKVKSKTNYRILVVDDEDEIRQYIRNELSDTYRISECSNGKEALDFILKEKPNLVVSDVMMPEMDGITLCKKIKSNVNINHIPIILLTAKSNDEDKAIGFDIGADGYVVKPFSIDLLKKRINNLLENRQRLEPKPSDLEENKSIIKQVVLRSSDQILLEKIMKIINDNIADTDLNVEVLAGGVGMSRVHMHRKLKELTNQSARDFIKSIRLKQAAEMLIQHKQNISEVAYALGFSNLSHFSNSFKEFYGVSPKEYAQQAKTDATELIE